MSYYEDFEENLLGSLECIYFEHYTFMQEPYVKYTFQKCKGKWIMKNGKEIDVKDMETSHIINSLNMILKICKNENWKATSYNIYTKLRKELDNRKNNKLYHIT